MLTYILRRSELAVGARRQVTPSTHMSRKAYGVVAKASFAYRGHGRFGGDEQRQQSTGCG